MSIDEGLVAWVEECLEPIGKVTARAMMGGATLYLDGTVFAIIAGDNLWFKADKVSDSEWDAIGAERFTYDMGGKIGHDELPPRAARRARRSRRHAALVEPRA